MNIFKDTMSEMTYEQVEKLVQQEAIVLFPVGIIEEHGFPCEEDYILKLTDMSFEEMFQISKEPRDAFDVHAGAFETATMREADRWIAMDIVNSFGKQVNDYYEQI